MSTLAEQSLLRMFGSGLGQHARLLTLASAQERHLPQSLVVEQVRGREAVNELFVFDVDALSLSTDLDLDIFLGEELTLGLLQPDGSRRAWHGLCTEAAWMGADGGVARFRVYGEVSKVWDEVSPSEELDLAAATNGGKAISCNDMFFSSMDNLLMPGRGVNMGDGWETKRNRTPGNRDWVIVRLGHPGTISRVSIDTAHFKGNYPDRFSLEYSNATCDEDCLNDANWQPLLAEQKLSADSVHEFKFDSPVSCSYIRLNIFPDGGISRLRVYGKKRQS